MSSDLARWLIIIPRDQRELYDRLRESLRTDAPFNVILERRVRERRGSGKGAAETERRRAERRQPQPVGLVYVRAVAPEAAAAPAATSDGGRGEPPLVVTAGCPACLQTLSFELPRFPKPPARLDAELIHVGTGAAPQHFAEIQAFTVTGRPLLVGRVQAFRPTSGAPAR